MHFFTSSRERRLWLWSIAVMAVIYATLGVQPVASSALRERDLLWTVVATGLAVVVIVVVVRWARARPGSREIGVGLAVAAAYVWALVRIRSVEERTHLIEYGVVAFLVYEALRERQKNGGSVRAPVLTAFALTAALGWLDEGIQSRLPNRVYDLADVATNVLAAAMAITAVAAVTWVRGRDR